eukprot:scaffold3932_cov87-Cyclotella_meneghiniana.AAC.24
MNTTALIGYRFDQINVGGVGISLDDDGLVGSNKLSPVVALPIYSAMPRDSFRQNVKKRRSSLTFPSDAGFHKYIPWGVNGY